MGNGYERITDALQDAHYRELRNDGDWSLWSGPKDKLVVILKTKDGGYQIFYHYADTSMEEDIESLAM
jgi:hypothetical protein